MSNLKRNLLSLKSNPNELFYYEEGNSVFVTGPQCYPRELFDCSKKNAPEMYKCDKCNFEGFLKVNLKTHMELLHRSQDKDLTIENFCAISDSTYNMSSILKYHYCATCDFSTNSLLVYLKHNIEHHEVAAMVRIPSPTPEPGPGQPPPHRKYRTKFRKFKEQQSFECTQCSAKTRSAYTLMKHIRLLHGFPDEFQVFDCKQCSFRTPHEGNFKKHQQRHEAEDNNDWLQCTQCTYKTKHHHYLERHAKANHTPLEKIKWVPCEHCEYRAKNKWIMKDHVISRHTAPEDINWLLCELCAYRCKNRRNLKQHLRGKHKLKI